MNNRFLIYGAAVVVAVIVIGSLVWFAGSGRPSETNETPKQPTTAASINSTPHANAAPPSTGPQVGPGATNAAPSDNASVKKLLQEMMRQKGLKPMAPPKEYLQTAVATHDNAKISRAFSELVYSGWPQDQVIAALKAYLNDSNPFLRYLAGNYLFVVGDNEGYPVLLSLVESNTFIDGIGVDVRIQAAETLAQFRQRDAIPAILDAYQKTQDGNYMAALIKLQASQVTPLIEAKNYYADPLALQDYGLVGAQKFIPQISTTFNSTQKPEVKAAAAWALATMTNDQGAINYLVQAGQAVINTKPDQPAIYGDGAQIMNYLGTIQTPQAKQTLEAGLSSADPAIVQAATLNLIFNQGGSAKANQVVAQAFTPASNPLGVDMALNLAPLLNDPQVQAAGQTFSQHDGSGAWQRAVDRKDWSVYNWTGGIYPVKSGK